MRWRARPIVEVVELSPAQATCPENPSPGQVTVNMVCAWISTTTNLSLFVSFWQTCGASQSGTLNHYFFFILCEITRLQKLGLMRICSRFVCWRSSLLLYPPSLQRAPAPQLEYTLCCLQFNWFCLALLDYLSHYGSAYSDEKGAEFDPSAPR